MKVLMINKFLYANGGKNIVQEDYGKIQIPLKKCWHNDIGQFWD